MDTGRRSIMSQRAGSGLFSSSAFAAEAHPPGRRETQQSGQAQQPSSRNGSIRKSGRFNSISLSSHHSRSSFSRGSVRGTRGGGAVDSSGLPFDRIACIDEEDGLDRTPKPLLATRSHGEQLPTAGWGSEGPGASEGPGGSDSSGNQVSSAGGAMLGDGIPSARPWLAIEATETTLDATALPPGMRPVGRESMMHGSRESVFLGIGWESSLHGLSISNTSSVRGSIATTCSNPRRDLQQEGAAATGATWALSAAMPNDGRAEVHSVAELQDLHQQRQQQQEQQQQGQQRIRSKATQCPSVSRASKGVQVLPWELRVAAASASPDTAGAEGDVASVGAANEAASAAAAQGEGGAGGDPEDEEAALLALQHFAPGCGACGADTRRGSPTPSCRGGSKHSQSSSRRGSMADFPRMSSMSGTGAEEWSRPSTGSMAMSCHTSIAGSEWSARDSMMSSRTSFAAFLAADGRGSMLGSVVGFYPPGINGGGGSAGWPQTDRTSVLSVGHGQGRRGTGLAHQLAATLPPQLSPEQVAAAAARREKARQEQALARMPGLLHKLKVAEKAVLLNEQQPKLAQYHSVQLCRVAPTPPASSATANAQHTPAVASCDQPMHATTPGSEHLGGAENWLQAAQGSSTAVSPLAADGLRVDGAGCSATGSSAASTPPTVGSLSGRHHAAELRLLWAWRSELSGELPVSCLAWSKAAPGLLAVGYGRLQYEIPGTGLMAVWSLSNPLHPLWHAATPCGVSTLSWSGKTPGTLAAGFFDGSVAVYDVSSGSGRGGGRGGSKSGSSEPLARAPPADGGTGAGGGHAEPVWQLKYVPRATDPVEEMLVSISSDGRVLEWKHAQGLERVELLRLKRQQRSTGAGAGTTRQVHGSSSGSGVEQPAIGCSSSSAATQGLLSRDGGGTCFDFSTADPRAYLVGTEEGVVHKCSTVFSEQYIRSYSGHLAPVYQVCFSPFSPSHFLTASADWSVRLWSEAQDRSLWTFQLPGARAEVADVAFSPHCATLFAAAAGNSLQLWDLESSVLVPRGMALRLGVRLTALAFSQAAPVVVTGADDGAVSVYSLAGMYDATPGQQEEQRRRLEDALRHHTARHISD